MLDVAEAEKTFAEAPASRSSAGHVRDGILHGLYSGRFVPGQKLVEADLVRAFGASRGYVREALARLETEGVVESAMFRGSYIRAFTPEEARNIDLVFAALMALAARQAAERVTANEAGQLARALGELDRFKENIDLYEYAAAREGFYRLLIQISGNAEIARTCPIMQSHIVRTQSGKPLSLAEHQNRLRHYTRITDAITRRDPRAAEQAVWDSLGDLSGPSRAEDTASGH